MKQNINLQRFSIFFAFVIISALLILCTPKKEEPVKETSPKIIVSNADGGDWANVATWVDGAIPTIDSDVNITGKVVVNGKAECMNLMIDHQATIEVMKGASLTVKHHIINEGTIINNGEITLQEKDGK